MVSISESKRSIFVDQVIQTTLPTSKSASAGGKHSWKGADNAGHGTSASIPDLYLMSLRMLTSDISTNSKTRKLHMPSNSQSRSMNDSHHSDSYALFTRRDEVDATLVMKLVQV
jgi:hypothetical protein